MRVLGVDPGYDRLGLALYEHNRTGKSGVLFSKTITTSRKKNFPNRLYDLSVLFKKTLIKERPDIVAIESLFFSKNQKTAMRVSETRGALILCAKEENLSVFEVAPNEVKVAVTGNGRASKEAVRRMVKTLTGFENKKALDDEIDAVAIAITASAIKNK